MNNQLQDDIMSSTTVIRPDQGPLFGNTLYTGVGNFNSGMLIGPGRLPPTVTYTGDASTTDTKAHNHYFKSVKGLEYVDVYRVLSLFNVTDPCLSHAVKKLLVAGGRGHKDIDKDIQDVIDSCLRWQEMRKEDKNV